MAIYHLHVKTSGRGAGKGAGGHARYLLRQGPYAKRTVEVVEGTTVRQEEQSRADEVVASFSGNMPSWAQEDPLAYWDAADSYERANGTVYREAEVALPAELLLEENLLLAREIAEALASVSGGATPYTLVIHRSRKNPNLLHVHLMLSDKVNDGHDRDPALWFRRAIPKTGRGSKKSPELGGAPKTQERIAETWLGEVVRPLWTKLANAALERVGLEERIDHRSLEEQRREQEALVEQALEIGDVVAVARHRNAAALLDKPAQPKRGRVLEHGGPEKAPGQARLWEQYEEACVARAGILLEQMDCEREIARLVQEIAEANRRRETARQEFEASHREPVADFVRIAQCIAALVVQEAQRAREEIRARWEDRQRQRVIRQEREARRQKLLVLAEALAGDRDCRLRIREAYREAEYQLQEKNGKWILVYPHGDLREEREAVSLARKAWEERRQHRERDRATEQESRPGIRYPSKPHWQVERERILEEVYGTELAEKFGRWYRIERLDDAWVLKNDSATVTDYGDRVTAAAGNDREIEAMIALAKAKGWEKVSLTGSAEFRERAALAFVREGFALTDPELERVAQKALRREAVLEKAMLRHGYRDPVEAQWTRDRWFWRQREREQRLILERELATREREKALAEQQERETRPGIRHADRSQWVIDRDWALSRKYDHGHTERAENNGFYSRWLEGEQGLLYERKKDGVRFIDQGPLVVVPKDERYRERAPEAYVLYAQARGWRSIDILGDEVFRLQAAQVALEEGLTVSDPDLEKRAQAAMEVERKQKEAEKARQAIRALRNGKSTVPLLSDAVRDALKKQTPWQEWRSKTTQDRYGKKILERSMGENWYMCMRPNLGGLYISISTNTGSLEVVDGGDIVRSESDGIREIPLMLDLARAKGWTMLNIEGSAPFREHAARAALQAGFDLADDKLEQQAREALKREEVQSLPNELAEIERRQSPSPKRGSTPGDDWF